MLAEPAIYNGKSPVIRLPLDLRKVCALEPEDGSDWGRPKSLVTKEFNSGSPFYPRSECPPAVGSSHVRPFREQSQLLRGNFDAVVYCGSSFG